MKQLKRARSRKNNIILALFAIMLMVLCIGTVPDISSGIATTSVTASLFMLPFAMIKLKPEDGGGGSADAEEKARVLAECKKAGIDGVLEKYPEIKNIQVLKDKIDKATSKEEVDKEIEKLQLAIDTLNASIEAMKEKTKDYGKGKGHKSLHAALVAAFEEKKDTIDAIVKAGGRQKETLSVEVKEVVTMGEENTIGAGATQYTLTENTGIISTIRKRELRYLANVSVGRIGTSRALWIEELDEQGTPIMIGEGDPKTQLSVRYEEATETVKKCAVYGKVTTELMADLPQLISYIENNLMRRLDIALENQLFSGIGTGDDLVGLEQYAQAYTGGNLSVTKTPNEYDVLRGLALQVEKAFGMANCVFVNPSTIAKLETTKDDNGQYIFPRWGANPLSIAGMKIVGTTAIPDGEFIGGDLSVVNVLIRSELGIQIGLDGNDFTQNKKTMLLEKRLVQFVSANDAQLIVKGDFESAIAVLLANS